jgi:hypothetical protein
MAAVQIILYMLINPKRPPPTNNTPSPPTTPPPTCGDFSRSISFCRGPSIATKSSRPSARHVSLVWAWTVAMLSGGFEVGGGG